MKKTIVIASLAVTALSMAFKPADQTVWNMDKAHAKLGFTVTHMMVSDVEGSFKVFDAKITSTKDDFSDAVVEMSADVNSVNTDNDKRDTHIKSADFFDAAKFPKLTFVSKSFKKVDASKYTVTGDLTLHGVTKTVALDVTCRMGTNMMSKKVIAGFKIMGTIKRSDFGIGSTFPSAAVSDEVAILANAEFGKN